MSYYNNVTLADGGQLDAFGALRVSERSRVFDGQFTYDLQPILYEQKTNGSGATISQDTTNRNALMTFSSTPTGGYTYMQTYEHFRYQPGNSQLIKITFNFIAAVANVLKFAGYSDGINGFEFQNNGTVNQFVLYSTSSNGNQTVTQSNWNIDKFDGTGVSGLTLDITKGQILVVDFQALYEGRVRMGFDINGIFYAAHQFVHANIIINPYIQTANLPIRVGMSCTGTVSTTMYFQCAAVVSEGGSTDLNGFSFSATGTATASNGTDTHILSIQPRPTFNSIVNRGKISLESIHFVATGNNAIQWKICIGQALTSPVATNINTTYSIVDGVTGTLSGTPALIPYSGYCYATGEKHINDLVKLNKYPITLDQSGAVRNNGRITILVSGIGANSACQCSLNWIESR